MKQGKHSCHPLCLSIATYKPEVTQPSIKTLTLPSWMLMESLTDTIEAQ
jgi:hypothetical protein